ncbi:MAG: DUF4136 domain-containing protein [Psychrobium sp.]|nr:DUF4136 domain-containing protein [Psychrobium sp.]
MKIKIAWCFALALTMLGCKSTPNYDYDQSVNFNEIKTYAWVVESKKSATDAEFFLSDINHKRIVSAIDKQLLAKGLQKVAPSQAQVLVNYHRAITTKVERDLATTHPAYWSFGYGFHHSNHMSLFMNINSLNRQYKLGSLLIDFINPDKQLIWRGAQETRLSKKSDPARRLAKINDAVAKILTNFPPSPTQ